VAQRDELSFPSALFIGRIGHRRAIQFWKLTDCSLEETTRALGVPMNTWKARLHRARRLLSLRCKGKTQHRRAASRSRKTPQSCLAELIGRFKKPVTRERSIHHGKGTWAAGFPKPRTFSYEDREVFTTLLNGFRPK